MADYEFLDGIESGPVVRPVCGGVERVVEPGTKVIPVGDVGDVFAGVDIPSGPIPEEFKARVVTHSPGMIWGGGSPRTPTPSYGPRDDEEEDDPRLPRAPRRKEKPPEPEIPSEPSHEYVIGLSPAAAAFTGGFFSGWTLGVMLEKKGLPNAGFFQQVIGHEGEGRFRVLARASGIQQLVNLRWPEVAGVWQGGFP